VCVVFYRRPREVAEARNGVYDAVKQHSNRATRSTYT
jgi:hypothetical protein